jgi:hypothetical protein
VAIVSRDERSGGCTLLVRFPGGWAGKQEAAAGTLECFLLEGEVRVSGQRVGSAGFAAVPRGSGGAELSSEEGAIGLVFWNPTPTGLEEEDVVTRSAWEIPWEITMLEGFPGGFLHKSLRQPDFSSARVHGGPGGFIRLVFPAPGWVSPNEERHPGCWEENILLRGDLLMPGRGLVRPGMCLANPAGHWHGPMATKGGALFLVHCDAPMRVEYRPHGPGRGDLDDYLQSAPWA